MSEEIIVKIAPDGATHIEANGFTGVSCNEATERLEIMLGGIGGKTKDKKFKPEYSLPTKSGVTNRL